ncbi:MAG: CRISPR-associated helicase Cas3' [Treponema sp.]|jgi:CRISPR-associated endonuclease/helicase Cas3|nr:CRISPR-associated helicase Cas3' [Treponema sp.]
MASKNNISVDSIFDLSSCLAKTYKLDGKVLPGIDILGHSIIAGEVAKEIIRRSIPALRDRLFPPGSELIAACHDIGKVYPLHQTRLQWSIAGHRSNPESEKPWKGHWAVSQAALDGCPKYIPEIAGRHHGYSPAQIYPATYEGFGGEAWQDLREELLEKLTTYFDTRWPKVENKTHAAVLSGLTCIADWIGSGSSFDGITHIEDISDLPARVQEALDRAGFVLPRMKQGLTFKAIFDRECRPVQSLFIESVSTPGIYVLEAPMGIGKTEAALYAAYKMFSAGKASGIYFALPTQLTSHKIHKRVDAFLTKVLEENSSLSKALLVHSSARFYETETEMGEDGEPGRSWFQAKKRRILAPFGVGTIDQALMSVMNVKHGFVRAFGLAGKVVILDEVHSYDSYTGALLDELVKGLEEMGCTVIILSATLTHERRKKILGVREKATLDSPPPASGYPDYPLISSLIHREDRLQEVGVETADTVNVLVRRVVDDGKAVVEALKRAKQGQQVLWIENTVDEAQRRYKQIDSEAKRCGVDTGLLHSRFVQHDREYNEDTWVGIFGKDGTARRGEQGRILVGTQVLEQSLDIDADFLVTRLCPTDMLLQRIGRLWRHQENNAVRPAEARREVWILSADYERVIAEYADKKQPHKVFNKELGKTAYIYDPYVLLRTLELWNTRTTLSLPQEIRSLVEDTYCERNEQAPLNSLKKELEQERARLRRLAFQGIASSNKTLPDTTAEIRYKNPNTRYSEMETRDVLLLRAEPENHDRSTVLVLSNGDSLELKQGLKNENKKEWRKRATRLSSHIVTVPEYQAPLSAPPEILDRFKEYIYTGSADHHEDSLRIVVVHEDNTLVGIDCPTEKMKKNVSKDFLLSYDTITGYRAEKKAGTKDEEE